MRSNLARNAQVMATGYIQGEGREEKSRIWPDGRQRALAGARTRNWSANKRLIPVETTRPKAEGNAGPLRQEDRLRRGRIVV